jgi:hypothetical protein
LPSFATQSLTLFPFVPYLALPGAGGLTKGSFLERVRPELMHLPTTNGSHCTGDGIRMVVDIGGGTTDIDQVQVHPTGIINPYLPDERTLFLAAEALRGEGGIILDCEGNRFCNDLGTRDYVSGMMWKQVRRATKAFCQSLLAFAFVTKHSLFIPSFCFSPYLTEQGSVHAGAEPELVEQHRVALQALRRSQDHARAHVRRRAR